MTLQLPPQCCGTCRHWAKSFGYGSGHGECEMNTYPRPDLDTFWVKMLTLDMSVCTKWEGPQTQNFVECSDSPQN